MSPMFYLLLALTTVLAATANAGGPVLDTDGDIIFDGSYYVMPRIFGPGGGGLTLAPRGGICPLYIGQEYSEVNMGIPVKFSDWRIKVAFVPESTNLNIKMDVAATICAQSTYWNVAGPDIEMKEVYLPAGPKPANGLFQIKKINDALGGYKIVYCPNDSSYCSDIGIFVDKLGVRRLVLSSKPFEVVFVKAAETKTSSKPIMSII